MATTKTASRKAADDYLELIRQFPLAPIKDDRQLREAFTMIDRLSVIDEDKLTVGQTNYLLVLSDLVEKYEERRHPIDLAHLDGIDVLAHLLEQNQMSASDLG